jgi:hypothetical protein
VDQIDWRQGWIILAVLVGLWLLTLLVGKRR